MRHSSPITTPRRFARTTSTSRGPGEETELAMLRESATRWLRRSAELAIGRYEIDEGLALLHRAVLLESDRQKQAQLWEEIGHANALRFDGEAFRAAMETAIELAGPSAELYTELALQTARRSGMWQRQPDRELVDEWIDRALELADAGSPTHARALAAVALWRKDEAAARELHAIAERLGDAALRSSALAALADVAWSGQRPRAGPRLGGGTHRAPSRARRSRRLPLRLHELGGRQSRHRAGGRGIAGRRPARRDGRGVDAASSPARVRQPDSRGILDGSLGRGEGARAVRRACGRGEPRYALSGERHRPTQPGSGKRARRSRSRSPDGSRRRPTRSGWRAIGGTTSR